MAPKQRGMGNPIRSYRGRIRHVHEQTWSRWKNQINWVHYASERVGAASISVNKQPIILVSVYMPHSSYPDHQVAKKTYKTITTAIEKDKGMKIIGGDFNAELGPGEGIELSSVGHYALKKANGRRE